MRKRIRQAALLQGITPKRAWTVLFDADSISPVGTRADLAYGLAAEVAVGNQKVRNDFDGVPVFERPIFNATWDDVAHRWVDFVKKGEAGFTFTPTETGRDVVFQSTPFWYQLDLSDTGRITRVSVSDRPLEGYTLAPMFRDGSTPVYRSAFEAALDYTDRKMHSRAGLSPCLSEPSGVRNLIEARSLCGRFETAAEWFSDYLLLLVEFATFNLQGVMHGVRGELTRLFNAASISSQYSKGLYCSEEPWFTKGDSLDLYAGDSEMEIFLHGTYTVSSVTFVEGAGYRVSFSGLDVDELMWRNSYWECAAATAKTGAALTVVTNATSGRASEALRAPIVWRGKENPWGNAPTMLEDVVFKLNKRGQLQLYRAAPGTTLIFYEGNYQADGTKYNAFAGTDSFVTGMAQNTIGDFLYPISFDDTTPDQYYATRMSRSCTEAEDDTFMVVVVGGGNDSGIGTNHATMELLERYTAGGRWQRVGGRMILEEN